MCRLDRNRAATFIHSIKKKRKEKKKRKKERGGGGVCLHPNINGRPRKSIGTVRGQA